jgi:hypothetical protein
MFTLLLIRTTKRNPTARRLEWQTLQRHHRQCPGPCCQGLSSLCLAVSPEEVASVLDGIGMTAARDTRAPVEASATSVTHDVPVANERTWVNEVKANVGGINMVKRSLSLTPTTRPPPHLRRRH